MAFERRMTTLYEGAIRRLCNTTLESYFTVPGKYTWRREEFNQYRLSIVRKYTLVYYFDELPDDLSVYVSSFLHKHVYAEFDILYPAMFVPPTWKLIHLDTNTTVNFNECIRLMNRRYIDDWSPAFTLEADMLTLIVDMLPLLRRL